MNTEGKDVVITPEYLVGFTEGDGCFLVNLRKDHRIEFRYFISQAIGNRPLLEAIRKYMIVGNVYQKSTTNGKLPACVYEVSKRDDIYNVIIPFFHKHRLRGIKAISFAVFEEIALLVKGRQDIRKLTSDEVKYITSLRSGMNKHYDSLSAGKPHA